MTDRFGKPGYYGIFLFPTLHTAPKILAPRLNRGAFYLCDRVFIKY